jgi:hypothetical protein
MCWCKGMMKLCIWLWCACGRPSSQLDMGVEQEGSVDMQTRTE